MPKLMTNEALISAQRINEVMLANTGFAIGNLSQAEFQKMMADLLATDSAVEKQRLELTALINSRDAQLATMNEMISRARSAIRAQFGADSTQYEQAGCKRKSDRKSTTHRLPAGNGDKS